MGWRTWMVAVAVVACCASVGVAQETRSPAPPEQLEHIPQPEQYDAKLAAILDNAAVQSQTLRTALPSFTCKEDGVSQVLRGDEIRKEVPWTGVIRAQRLPDGRLEETHDLATVKGKPASKHSTVPYYVHDAFTRVLTYVAAAYQPCYHYTLSAKEPNRVDFVNRRPFNVACGNFPGTEGFFTLDDAGEIQHMERTLPQVDAEDWPVPFAAVDMVTVQLGEKSYRLAGHMESERGDGKDTLREDVKFTDCKLFKSSIRILPDVNVVPSDETAPLKPR